MSSRPQVFRRLVVAAALAAVPAPVLAQDNHYWTDQFGNSAQLLGGAVIGADQSLSAVFYNPGRIGFSLRSDVIVTGNIFELEKFKIAEVTPPQRDLSQTRFRLLPSMIAGEIKAGWLGGNRLAYSFLTRVDSSVRSGTNFVADSVPALPSAVFITDDAAIDLRLTEYWAGVTWARPVGSFGVGVTTFVAIRNQRLALTNLLQGVSETGAVGLDADAFAYDYHSWRVLWKIGVATSIAGWKLGATVTTPGLRLFGSGETSFTDSRAISDDPAGSFVRTGFQDGLRAEYKSPLSVGAGGSRVFEDWTVHGSVEWFAPIGAYVVIDAAPGTVPDVGEVEPDITHEAAAVFNFALGAERRFAGLTAYGSFHSDFSAAVPGTNTNMSVTNWDVWHLGGGVSFKVGSSDMTLGLVYAFGSSDPIVFIEPDKQVEIDYSRFTFLLGFDLGTGLATLTGGS